MIDPPAADSSINQIDRWKSQPTGVWLNDPGISWGRGYHISYAQLAHAIESLDQHHLALNQGQVLLLLAPKSQSRCAPETSRAAPLGLSP